jgi:hypothetical protein
LFLLKGNHTILWSKEKEQTKIYKNMLAIKRNKRHHIISRYFLGLCGSNDSIYFSGEFLGLYGNNDGIYSFQENSLVYMVTMMVYILFRRIPWFIW